MPLGECLLNFNLEKAICNHGFFMMAPNCWNPSTKTLQRPLRLADSANSVNISISHPSGKDFLVIEIHQTDHVSLEDEQNIVKQVARMLRISQKDEMDLRDFHEIHAEAKNRGFGRLFRSPSLFEDIIKSILLCNTTWQRTLRMARALCQVDAELFPNSLGNFPTSKQIASLNEHVLEQRCKLGYRARTILQFAKNIEMGKVNINKYEEYVCWKPLYKALKKNRGFGPFVCANAMFCIGFYNKVPSDSETVRHLKEVHSRESCNSKTVDKYVKEIYDNYAPFQCLVYWMEMLESYEKNFGKLSDLDNSNYHIVTGSNKFKF